MIGFFLRKEKPSSFFPPKHKAHNLLQGGLAQLDGDVSEEAVPLRAEISDDVGVRVRLPQQLHLSLGHLEALGQDPLDRDAASIEFPPEVDKNSLSPEVLLSLSQEERHPTACQVMSKSCTLASDAL